MSLDQKLWLPNGHLQATIMATPKAVEVFLGLAYLTMGLREGWRCWQQTLTDEDAGDCMMVWARPPDHAMANHEAVPFPTPMKDGPLAALICDWATHPARNYPGTYLPDGTVRKCALHLDARDVPSHGPRLIISPEYGMWPK